MREGWGFVKMICKVTNGITSWFERLEWRKIGRASGLEQSGLLKAVVAAGVGIVAFVAADDVV